MVGAHSYVAGSVCDAAPAATPIPNGMCVWCAGSVGLLGDLPDEARELAGDSDSDGGALL